MTTFMVANDAHGDPTIFSELGNHPLPVVSRSQFTLPSYWDALVTAVLAGQEAVAGIVAGLADTPCGQCGHARYEHDVEGCENEIGRPDSCECVRFDGPQP